MINCKGSGSGCDLTEVLSQHLPGGMGKTVKNQSQDSQCSGQDFNLPPLKYQS
jgi:hypothetical protein